MKILIDIGHLRYVHLFRSYAPEMQQKGYSVLFTCREKEFEVELLKAEVSKYISFEKKLAGIAGKVYGLLKFGIQKFKAAVRFQPDIILSHDSLYAAHGSFLLRKPHISFEGTFNFEQITLYKPFSDVILIMIFHTKVLKGHSIFRISWSCLFTSKQVSARSKHTQSFGSG